MAKTRPFKARGPASTGRSTVRYASELHDEALAWVVRLTSGLAEAGDREAFIRWRDQSSAHAAALADARDLWTGVGPALVAGQERQVAEDFIGSLYPPAAARRVREARSAPKVRRPVLTQRWAGMAAALVVAMGSGLFMAQSPLADVRTGGGTATRVLADGTQVMLAPNTALDVDFGEDGVRRVTLERGEAMFDVAHDPSRPFVVRSDSGEVRVLGTAFSVRRTGGMTKVVVARGRVEVKSGSATRILKPDRMVVYGLTTMGGIQAVDARTAQGWTNDRLVFENQALGDVIAELDRFDGRKVVLLNREVRIKRVNAVVDLTRTDHWLSALEQSEHLTVTRLPGLIIIR